MKIQKKRVAIVCNSARKESPYKRTAFTLAEVLVCLTVIGVLASMTIPTLMKNHQKQQWIAGFKEAYSISVQATKMVIADNGGGLQGVWSTSQEMMDVYKPHLKYVKVCEDTYVSVQNAGCWALNNTNLYGDEYTPYQAEKGLILTNGMNVYFKSTGSYVYDFIVVDTNGFKGPNTVGKDIHNIIVYPDTGRIVPSAARSDVSENYVKQMCPSDLANSGSGSTCGYRIIRGDYAEDY